MICKKCGAENSADSNFCLNCGEKLDINESVVEQPIIETPIEPVQPVEPVIETPVQPEQPVVQTPVEQPVYQTPNNNTTEPKSDSTKIIIICLLSFIILILIGVVVLFATGIFNFGNLKPANKNSSNSTKNTQTEKKVEAKKTYKLGEAVTTVDGSNWHVIGLKGDTAILLLDELVVDETGYGKSANPEDQVYEKSVVKDYIDETYLPDLKAKITSSGGDASKIKGRIITADEYLNLTKTAFNDNYTSTSFTTKAYDNKEEVCKMIDIMSLTKSFWTATNVKELDKTSKFYGVIYIFHESGKFSYFCNKNMEGNFAVVDLATNSNAQLNATFVGIRPVIETPTSNIK